jgi:hypothetical protein
MWGADTTSLGQLLVLLPLVYLVVAAIGIRGSTWATLLVCCAFFVGLRAQDRVTPETALLVLAGVALVAGFFRPGGRAPLLVQAAGMMAFGALALWAAAVDADTARYLVAAGWFGHGIWDFAHLHADRTVARTYAEWCGALDVLIAAMLLAG